MKTRDPASYRKRVDELQTLLRGLTDVQAVRAVHDEIDRLEAKIREAGEPDDRDR